MKVNFYANLRAVAGGKTVDIDVPESVTAQELLAAIVNRFPRMRAALLDEDGGLFGHVHMFINGRDVQFLDEQLNTRLQPDDEINVFPAVGGG